MDEFDDSKYTWDPAPLQALINGTNMSIKALADTIDISDQSLYKYLRGDINPTVATLIKLADYFSVPLDFMMGRCSLEQSELLRDHYGLVFMLLRRAPYEAYLSGRRPIGSRIDYRAEAPWPYNLLDDLVKEIDDAGYWDSVITEDQMDALVCAMDTLTPKEKDCLNYYYKLGNTLEETGDYFGVTRERARQVIAKGLRKLRHPSRLNMIRQGYKKAVEMQNIEDIDNEIEAKRMELELKLRQLEVMEKEYAKRQLEYELRASPTGRKNDGKTPYFIEDLDLSARSYNCLCRANIRTVKQLIKAIGDGELDCIRSLGMKSKEEILVKVTDYLGESQQYEE